MRLPCGLPSFDTGVGRGRGGGGCGGGGGGGGGGWDKEDGKGIRARKGGLRLLDFLPPFLSFFIRHRGKVDEAEEEEKEKEEVEDEEEEVEDEEEEEEDK